MIRSSGRSAILFHGGKAKRRKVIDIELFKRLAQVPGEPEDRLGIQPITLHIKNDPDAQDGVAIVIHVARDLNPLNPCGFKLLFNDPADGGDKGCAGDLCHHAITIELS